MYAMPACQRFNPYPTLDHGGGRRAQEEGASRGASSAYIVCSPIPLADRALATQNRGPSKDKGKKGKKGKGKKGKAAEEPDEDAEPIPGAFSDNLRMHIY